MSWSPKIRIHTGANEWQSQLWNEPNNKVFWLPAPNATQYVALVAAVAATLADAGLAAEILVGPAFAGPLNQLSMADGGWLADVIAAGVGNLLAAFSVHPYRDLVR